MSLARLNAEVIKCRLCPRLVEWRESITGPSDDYWNRPVPGFGDAEARLLVIGLAPGAQGANRTGRVFTGDFAGDWLYRGLYEGGFASAEKSVSRDDDLKLTDAYITNVARCVPPANRVLGHEVKNCADFFMRELALLPNLQAVLALGHVAHRAFLSHVKSRSETGLIMNAHRFGHGARHDLGEDWPTLFNSYHTSRYNVSTKVLKWPMFMDVIQSIKAELDPPPAR